jgi:hypothetical protein
MAAKGLTAASRSHGFRRNVWLAASVCGYVRLNKTNEHNKSSVVTVNT